MHVCVLKPRSISQKFMKRDLDLRTRRKDYPGAQSLLLVYLALEGDDF